MPRVPDTRASLILRLPTKTDAQAWREFVSIYEPFLHRFIRRQGMQDADARELVQDVLLSVVQAVGQWQTDASRAKFRTWLFRIARNRMIDVLSNWQRRAVRGGARQPPVAPALRRLAHPAGAELRRRRGDRHRDLPARPPAPALTRCGKAPQLLPALSRNRDGAGGCSRTRKTNADDCSAMEISRRS